MLKSYQIDIKEGAETMGNNIGNIIKNRRLELNITLDEVGKAVGVSKSTVQRWESGQITNMRRDRIDALSKILDLSPLIFVDKDSAPAPKKESPLSAHEKAMVNAYHKAPDNIQNVVNVALNSYSDEDLPTLAEKEKGETDIHSVG
jgi:transcriptional regulator with XRE-family HTH domain